MTSTLNPTFTTQTAHRVGAGFGLRVLRVADFGLRALRDAAPKAVRMGSPLTMTARSQVTGITVYTSAGNHHALAGRSAG
jgi:hypothetical protein